jgi:hypothetical protein
MKRVLIAALLMLTALPALAQRPPLSTLWVGHWFGSGQTGDRSQMFIDTFNPDGSFRALHRACVQGKATDQSQIGRWRINGNILTINMTAVNGEPRSYEDRYRIDAVDGKTQDYTLVANNFPYKSRKVDGKFQMPPCDLVS